jgi:hypothetical protein
MFDELKLWPGHPGSEQPLNLYYMSRVLLKFTFTVSGCSDWQVCYQLLAVVQTTAQAALFMLRCELYSVVKLGLVSFKSLQTACCGKY